MAEPGSPSGPSALDSALEYMGRAPRNSPFTTSARSFSAIRNADDRVLREIVRNAELAPLLVTLAHITGDHSLLDPRLRPPLQPSPAEITPQGGMSDELQAVARELAFDALQRLRSDGGRIAAEPTPAELVRLMTFITGEGADEYLSLLRDELQLGADPGAPEWRKAALAPERPFTVAVVGAGMSGLAAAYRLAQAEVPFVVFEKNEDVGGVWLENTYPGCRLDTNNFAYTYSFAPSAGWTQQFTPREPIHRYFRAVADTAGLLSQIRFGTEVVSATFDEETAEWILETCTTDGRLESVRVQAVITAVGQLNRPSHPPIEGRESFGGESWHSSRWDHEVPVDGLRVAVIGTGASAYQIVPAIASRVGSLKVFQRSAPWMLPTPAYHEDVPAGMRWLLDEMPFFDRWVRFYQFWIAVEGRLKFVQVDPTWQSASSVSASNEEMRTALIGHLAEQLSDRPDLLRKMTPSYPPGAKRMLRDNGVWAGALKRDNVELVTDTIDRITESGVVTVNGTAHDVDVIIYATGFRASHFLAPMTIVGRGGVNLHEQWGDDPRAYLGITVPNFPNLFCVYGPNTALVVNGSAVFFSEAAVHYVLECIRLLLTEGHDAMDCRRPPYERYNERVDDANRRMAWGLTEVDNWYKGKTGRVTQVWPHSLLEYWRCTRAPAPADFEFLSVTAQDAARHKSVAG